MALWHSPLDRGRDKLRPTWGTISLVPSHNAMMFVPCHRLRDRLSLSETVLLAEVPEERVRKDIERGWLKPNRSEIAGKVRPNFAWADVYIFAAIYTHDYFTPKLRSCMYKEFKSASEKHIGKLVFINSFHQSSSIDNLKNSEECSSLKIGIDRYFYIDFSKVADDVKPRVDLYAEGLKKIEEKAGTLGGDAVFCNTRLSVRHVGEMYNNGEPIEYILEDYPYLSEADVRFARMYHLAHPAVGRPKGKSDKRDELQFPSR